MNEYDREKGIKCFNRLTEDQKTKVIEMMKNIIKERKINHARIPEERDRKN